MARALRSGGEVKGWQFILQILTAKGTSTCLVALFYQYLISKGLQPNTLVAVPYFAKLTLPPKILEKSIIYLFGLLYFSESAH